MKIKSNLNKFMTLLENDVYRSLKFVIPIIVAFFIAHIGFAYNTILNLKSVVSTDLKENRTIEELINEGLKFGFYDLFGDSIYFVMIWSISAILIYTLLLWNMEWMGRSKRIYTLLALPVKRSYILLSKTCTILLFVVFNLVVQIATLFLDKFIMNLSIDKRLIIDESVLGVFSTSSYSNAFNLTSNNIVFTVIFIITSILLVGLVVLLARSFKIKGLLLGILSLILYVAGLIGMTIIAGCYFYLNFKLMLCIIYSLISGILVYMLSNYLLNNKLEV